MSDYDQLEFRHFKYIEAVAITGTFTAAADRVHTTQSNISTQIKHIEEVFGIRLFVRDNDGASITPLGEIFRAVGTDLLTAREEVIDMVKALRTGKITPLNLGYSSLIEKRTLAATTDRIQFIFPHCEIVTEGDELPGLEAAVADGRLDGALVTLPISHNEDFITYTIEREQLSVCLRSDDPLAVHEAIPAHLLNRKLSLFHYPKVHPLAHTRMLELLDSVGITPRDSKPTTNREHIQWMVQERTCYALVRPGARLLPGLTTRPIHGTQWTIDTAVVMRRTSQHPALAMLMRNLKKEADQVGASWTQAKLSPHEEQRSKKTPQAAKPNDRESNVNLRAIRE